MAEVGEERTRCEERVWEVRWTESGNDETLPTALSITAT